MEKGNRITLIVILTIIFSIVIVSLVNVGLSIFLEQPQYDKYCPVPRPIADTEISCTSNGGVWQNTTYQAQETMPVIKPVNGYCDVDYTCRQNYDKAIKDFNQIKFYIFTALGVILILLGLFISMSVIQYTGLVTGTVLIIEGIVYNFSNKIAVFITLIIVLILIGIGAWRIFSKK